ncbi:hypothetical protein F5X99DRAFT_50382 [Biscogniauxia marginata]|nr:hypothetical protein F5X99DRAFT_50382 [Biscogniauxia marginata]
MMMIVVVVIVVVLVLMLSASPFSSPSRHEGYTYMHTHFRSCRLTRGMCTSLTGGIRGEQSENEKPTPQISREIRDYGSPSQAHEIPCGSYGEVMDGSAR